MRSEFITRAIWGFVYAAVVLSAVYFHPLGLLALLVVIWVGGSTELKHLLGNTENKPLLNTTLVLGVMLLWVHQSFTQDFQNHLPAFLAFLTTGIITHFILSPGSEKSSQPLQKSIFSIIYLLLPLALAINIAYTNGFWQPKLLLALFFFLWANDTFAYMSGMALGKHKLIERLSPKKSIEGFIGGLIGTLAIAYVISLFWVELSLFGWLGYAVVASVFGTLGDLLESALKRAAGVKDAGNLIPGHGGILDRLDSFLFAAPITYFYLHFIAS